MPTPLRGRALRRYARRNTTPTDLTPVWLEYKRSGSVLARNRLVTHYMKTHVRPIAVRIHAGLPQQVEVDDLVQQGYLGLVEAMDRYEMGRDTRFETFSRRRIAGAIQDYLRQIDPVPRLTRSRSKKMQAAMERFQRGHGRPPSEEELRGVLDVPTGEFHRYLNDHQPMATVSFCNVRPESDLGEDAESDGMHSFEDLNQPGPSLDVARRDLRRWITRGFDRRDRLIIILYYYEQMTMREIGSVVGISESRVSQRLESILECLKSRLAAIGAEQEFIFA